MKPVIFPDAAPIRPAGDVERAGYQNQCRYFSKNVRNSFL
jgi:hypothetical protein